MDGSKNRNDQHAEREREESEQENPSEGTTKLESSPEAHLPVRQPTDPSPAITSYEEERIDAPHLSHPLLPSLLSEKHCMQHFWNISDYDRITVECSSNLTGELNAEKGGSQRAFC